jgi:hypothetical protein
MSREVDPQQNQQQDGGDPDVLSSGGAPSTCSGRWIGEDIADQDDLGEPLPQQQQQSPQRQPQQQVPQPGQQYEIRLKTGHVFRGNTPEEATAAAQAHFDRLGTVQAPTTYQGRSASNQDYQQQQPQPSPSHFAQGAIGTEAFFKEFAADPRGAMEKFFEDYFGDDPRPALSTSYAISVQVSDRIAIADFLAANNDFPASTEAGAMLIKRLEQDGVDLTSWNLEVAYRQLVRENLLAPLSPEDAAAVAAGGQPAPQQQQRQPQYQQPIPEPQQTSRGRQAPTPPPARTRGADAGALGDRELTIAEFENLSSADMRTYMQRRRQMSGR